MTKAEGAIIKWGGGQIVILFLLTLFDITTNTVIPIWLLKTLSVDLCYWKISWIFDIGEMVFRMLLTNQQHFACYFPAYTCRNCREKTRFFDRNQIIYLLIIKAITINNANTFDNRQMNINMYIHVWIQIYTYPLPYIHFRYFIQVQIYTCPLPYSNTNIYMSDSLSKYKDIHVHYLIQIQRYTCP